MPKKLQLVGMRFGRLIVKANAGSNKFGATLWGCVCDCGNKTTVIGFQLKNGRTTSCGCLVSEFTASINFKHGHATKEKGRTPTYRTWRSMIVRCNRPVEDSYKYYGGRGIKVCDKWLHSYPAFLADMGDRVKGTTIDRIDVDGNYEPGNCRWATAIQQRANRRDTVKDPLA